GGGDGAPSIHDIEEGIRLDELPPVDADERALLRERIVPGSLSLEQYARGTYGVTRSWTRIGFSYQIVRSSAAVEIRFQGIASDGSVLGKRIRFEPDGSFSVRYEWDPHASAAGDWFTVELSLFRPVSVSSAPEAEIWRHPVETIAKSERGLDRTVQGESVTLRWPVESGSATVRIAIEP
ncbi:MAG: alpha-amylase/4-alpha-glucanotransferase domain-containing protein, partial [Gemmatimonadota bacterium]